MTKKNSVLWLSIICAFLLLQAQAHAQDNLSAESDPVDVLGEIDALSQDFEETSADVPAPEIMSTESAPEAPSEPEAPFVPEQQVDVPPMETMPTPPAEMTPEFTQIGSDPDLNKEAEFHRIYKTYNEQPTSVESWEQAVSTRESKSYSIQKGDTLSDLSQTLFNDPFYWPKIWSLNSERIGNPHEIKPGLNIQFFPGNAMDAPTLAVNSGESNSSNGNSGESMASVPAIPSMAGAVIPPPKYRTPLLKKLPPSLPGYELGIVDESRQEVRIDLMPSKFPEVKEDMEYFLSETKVPSVGKVISVDLDVNAAGNFQDVYVELNGSPDKNYVVQSYRSRLTDPRTGDDTVEMIEIQGEIVVGKKVNEEKNIYRAKVTKTLHPIRVGSFLTAGKIPQVDPKLVPLTTTVKANIIGGAYDNNRLLLMVNSYIFLDRGTSEGLEVGQCLPIFANEDLRNKSTAKINDRMIGILKVTDTSSGFATGMIMRAEEDVRTGDYVGGRPVLKSDTVGYTPPARPEEVDLDAPSESSDVPSDSDTGLDDFDF